MNISSHGLKPQAIALACTVALSTAYTPQLAANEAALEEILVTARNRVETLQDVPVTVSAFDQSELDRFGVVSLTDVGRLVPNMQIHSGGPGSGSSLKLRGVGTSTISAAFDPAVALNIDGVVLSSHRLIVAGQMDMRQIEVLKGPQSLYFGKSATAGVVSIHSNDPGDQFEMILRGEYAAEHDGTRLEAVVSGPITDTFGARLAIAGGETDELRENLNPTVKNKYRGEERSDARLTLRWDPTEDFSAKLKTTYSRHESDGPNTPYNINCPEPQMQQTNIASLGIVLPPGYYDCKMNEKMGAPDIPEGYLPAPGSSTFSDWNNGTPYTDQESLLTSLQLDWDINDSLALTSITAYLDLETDLAAGFDYAHGAGSSHAFNGYESLSQEFRLESNYSGSLNFSAGIYYADIEQALRTGQSAINFALVGLSDPITGNGYDWDKEHYLDTETWSAFAAFYWDITEDLELTVGVRYTDDEKEGEIRIPYMHAFLMASGFMPSGTVITEGVEFEDDSWNPEVSLNWHINEDVSTYLAYKTGYKAGGVDNSALPSAGLDSGAVADLIYESENGEGFELGIKSMLLDGTLRANASVYYYVYEDLQRQQFDGAALQYKTFNAGEVTTQGAEADLLWSTQVDGLDLRAAIAWTDAEYTGSTIDVTGVEQKGEPVSGSTDLAANFGAIYQASISDSWMWSLTGDARYNDGYALGGGYDQDSYWVYDASVSLYSSDNKYEIALIGRNLGDEFYAHTIAGRPFACQTDPAGGCAAENTIGTDGLVHTNQGREYILRFTYRL